MTFCRDTATTHRGKAYRRRYRKLIGKSFASNQMLWAMLIERQYRWRYADAALTEAVIGEFRRLRKT